MKKIASLFLVVLSSLLLVGCGGSDLTTVKGNVTLDGKPLANAFLEFTPTASGASVGYGKTDVEGNYQMESSRDTKGVSPGSYGVKITTADLGDGVPNIKEQVPAQYNANSDLTCDVKESESNVFDFELSSEGEIVVDPSLDDG